MWGKRRKRRTQLSRQLALGLLEDAMGRVQQQEWDDDEDDPGPYPGAAPAPEAGSAAGSAPPDLRTADVPVDNCTGPAADDDPPPRQELPVQRTRKNSHHGTFG